jgi:DNA-binding NtrC family response regulator
MKILLVEDEAFMQEALSSVIGKTGIEVIKTDNIKTAKEILQNENISILITDLYLPKPEGYDLINFVKTDSKLTHIPVIAITGYDNEGAYDASGVHADIFLKKPFQLEDLRKAIRKIAFAEAGE